MNETKEESRFKSYIGEPDLEVSRLIVYKNFLINIAM